jgi:hypothetical protein
MTQKLKTGKSLGVFFDTLVEEAVKQALYQRSLQEKEKQDSLSSSMTSTDPDEAPDKAPDVDHSSKTGDDDEEAMESGKVSADDVIEKLNAIRSGHSFRDEKVKGNMQQYVESLSDAEKTALLAFLKGISQIVTGEIAAQQASDPSEKPADVKMKKGPEPAQVKHIKPNVIKSQQPKTSKKPGAEDTSGPVPITPKKK